MAAVAAPVRAPRLTDKVLTEDLPELIREADDSIAYLTDALGKTGMAELKGPLRATLDTKRLRLIRARDWLAGKVAAELNHRED